MMLDETSIRNISIYRGRVACIQTVKLYVHTKIIVDSANNLEIHSKFY